MAGGPLEFTPGSLEACRALQFGLLLSEKNKCTLFYVPLLSLPNKCLGLTSREGCLKKVVLHTQSSVTKLINVEPEQTSNCYSSEQLSTGLGCWHCLPFQILQTGCNPRGVLSTIFISVLQFFAYFFASSTDPYQPNVHDSQWSSRTVAPNIPSIFAVKCGGNTLNTAKSTFVAPARKSQFLSMDVVVQARINNARSKLSQITTSKLGTLSSDEASSF